MRLKYCALFFLPVMLISLGLSAGVLKGVVTDAKTNQPLGGVMVTATSAEMPQGAVELSDENGQYTFSNLPAGTYTVMANYGGAKTKTPVMVTLAADGTAEAKLVIDESEAAAEIVNITASRIPRPNLDAAVPVTTVSAKDILSTGEVTLGDALQKLPEFLPSFTSQTSARFIGTAGLNILDLRGMGPNRTLVLENGRRHISAIPGDTLVDINSIPVDLLERVDVVTGGNSAVYGSDAVAGVVNFVTKRDFEGLKMRSQYGISSHNDRPTFSIAATGGKNFDENRGNIAGSVHFDLSDPLYYTDREFTGAFTGRSQFQATQNTTGEPPEGDGVFDTTFLSGIKNNNFSTGGLYTSSCTGDAVRRAVNCSGVKSPTGAEFGNTFVFTPDGRLVPNSVLLDFRPFNGSLNGQGGLGTTLRETGVLQSGTKNYGVNLLASYKVVDEFRPFLEAKYLRTNALSEGQPTFSTGPLNPAYSIDNPFLTQQARDLLVKSLAPGATTFRTGRFNVDFGGRGEDHTRDLYRFVAGADGKFFDTWRYEGAFNFGRINTYYQTRGNVDINKFANAVDAVKDANGKIVCRINADADPTNDDPTCAPLNMFGFGAPSPEALNYVRYMSTRNEWGQQLDASGYVSGDFGKLFKLQGGPIAFSLGAEWRQESGHSAFDPYTAEGNTFLNSIPDFDPPTLNVYEGFAELRIPLLANLPFAHELTIESAGRVSTYDKGDIGTVWTGNVGAIYAPVADVRFRGSYAVAVRAPTSADLYQPDSQNFLNNLRDPCGQQNISAGQYRAANCAAAKVPTTQQFGGGPIEPFTNVPTSGISGLLGGNDKLSAEKSNSYTVGTVIEPSFVPGLVFTMDYYNIDLTNAINTPSAQTVIDNCYDSPDGIDNIFCKAVFRNPDGTFAGQSTVNYNGGVVALTTTGPSFHQQPFNFARQNTSGIDFDLAYIKKFGDDWRFNGRAIVAYLINRDNYTSIAEPNRLMQQKLTLGNPEWNGMLRLNLGYKFFDFVWATRYIGKMTIGAWGAQNSEQGRPPTNLDQFPVVYYPVITYSDIRANVKIDAIRSNVYFGIDNLFDQIPPYGLTGINSATNGNEGIYSNTGRFFYFGMEFEM